MTAAPVTDGLLLAPVRNVLAVANPFTGDPWGIGPLTPAQIVRAIHTPEVCTTDHWAGDYCRACELNRIAWFTAHGIDEDDPHPVTVDLGYEGFVPDWPILDGNHRVAAAMVRGDEFIPVVPQGDWDRAVAVLLHGADLWDLVDTPAMGFASTLP